MGSGDIGATPAELQGAGRALDQAGAELRKELDGLTKDVDDLLGAHWDGATARGFASSWAHWLRGVTESLEALDGMSALIAEAGTGFESIDTTGHGAMRDVSGQ